MNEIRETVDLEQELKVIAKGAGIAFFGKSLGAGFKYITQIVLARFLGSTMLGIYALAFVIHEMGVLLARMGLLQGALRYVSIYWSKKDRERLKGTLWSAILLPFIPGILLATGLIIWADSIANIFFSKPELAPSLRIFAFGLPFFASMLVAARATTGFQTTKYLVSVKEYFQPFVNLLLIVLLCLLGFGLSGASAAWVFSVILGLAVALYFLRKIFPDFLKREFKPIFESKQLIKFSFPLLFSEILVYILFRIDILMLGYFCAASDLGIYRAATQTALLVLIFNISINNIFAPLIADLIHKENHFKLDRLFKDVGRWNFYLTTPLFVLILAVGKEILSLFGPDFYLGWLPLVVLSAAQVINAGAGGISLVLVMSGHQYLRVLSDSVMVLINITLNLLLIPRLGIMGAAIATAISITGGTVLNSIIVFLLHRVHPYSWKYVKAILSGILAILFALLALRFFNPSIDILRILIIGGGVILAYTIALWMMGLEESDKLIIRTFKEKIKRVGQAE
jgi:O-antigen/teichoic acid export membrane protein